VLKLTRPEKFVAGVLSVPWTLLLLAHLSLLSSFPALESAVRLMEWPTRVAILIWFAWLLRRQRHIGPYTQDRGVRLR
jgi:hypothetical protein